MSADGRRDFDWIFGDWSVRNLRLADPMDPACDDWIEFPARSRVVPNLAGWGHLDTLVCYDAPRSSAFEALTLRLFDPAAQTWSIHWSSSRFPGRLDPPVVGAFTGTLGVFEGEDEIGGKRVRLRFEWRCDDVTAPTWQQSVSVDGGDTWWLNWKMALSRS